MDNFLHRTKINADYQQKKYRLTKLSNGNFFRVMVNKRSLHQKIIKRNTIVTVSKGFSPKKITLTLTFSDFPYFEFFSKTPTIYKLIKLF